MSMKRMALLLWLSAVAPLALATPATDAEFARFRAAGAKDFSAMRGSQLWEKTFPAAEGEKRSCTTCHGSDLGKPGKHAKTKKVIDPMAITVNPRRYTDEEKIEKWFKRNCEWVMGQECTAQEKGDILQFLLGAK